MGYAMVCKARTGFLLYAILSVFYGCVAIRHAPYPAHWDNIALDNPSSCLDISGVYMYHGIYLGDSTDETKATINDMLILPNDERPTKVRIIQRNDSSITFTYLNKQGQIWQATFPDVNGRHWLSDFKCNRNSVELQDSGSIPEGGVGTQLIAIKMYLTEKGALVAKRRYKAKGLLLIVPGYVDRDLWFRFETASP